MKQRSPLVLEVVIVGGFISVFHFFISEKGLYWSIDWIDALMHFLGGAWIGLFSAFFLSVQSKLKLSREDFYSTSLTILLFVISIGLGWELYEIFTGLTIVATDLVDTISDLIFDLIGGFVSLWYLKTAITSVRESKDTNV